MAVLAALVGIIFLQLDDTFVGVQDRLDDHGNNILITIKCMELLYNLVVYIYICDRACENRPCEHKKLPVFSLFGVS